MEQFKPWKRESFRKHDSQSSEAKRRSGQSGSCRPGAGAPARSDRQPVRPVGYPRHQAQPVSDVFLHEAPEHRGSRRSGVSGLTAAHLGYHISLLWAGFVVQAGKIPPGRGHVRIHLHARPDVHRQVPGDLPASPLRAQEERSLVRGRLLDAQPDIQLPSSLHILLEGGGGRCV